MKIPDAAARSAAGAIRPALPNPGRKPPVGPGDTPSSSGASADPAVRVDLSGRARELHEALRVAKAAPDVRTEKVAETRQRLADGTYELDAAATARRMIDRRA